MPVAFRIRPGSVADLPLLREMLYEAAYWRPGVARPSLEAGLTRPDLPRLLEGWGTRPGDTAVIGQSRSGEPLGAAWFRFWSADVFSYGFVSPEIPELAIAVRPGARRQGLGRRMIVALLQEAARAGIAQVSLSVEPDNPAAALYRSVGFLLVAHNGGAVTM